METTIRQCYIIQLLVCFPLLSFSWTNPKGSVLPVDPKLWAGGTLMLQCEVTDMGISMETKTLYFKWNNTRISEQFITRGENKSNIELTLTDVRMEDEGTYYCYLNDTIIGGQYVRIFRKPVPVENITCVVYDWAWMRCSWGMGDHYHYPHLINVSVNWQINHPGAGQYQCNHLTKTSCTWMEYDGMDGFKPDMTYRFLVIVNNIVMENSTKKKLYTIDTRTIVKPAAVRNLTTTAENSTCMEVAFRNEKPEREKHCVIQLHSKWQKVVKKLLTDSALIQTITVCGLHPNARYHISVRCRPRSHGKFFSDETVAEHIMPEDAPSSPPVLHVGSFYEAAYPGNSSLRVVTVYWKPIPEIQQNGRIIYYELTVNGTTEIFEDVENNQGSVNLRLDKDYEIKVRAHTQIGPSNYSLPLYVKSIISRMTEPTMFYVVVDKASNALSSFNVELHWGKSVSGWELVTNFTLYYCLGWRFNQTCRGQNSGINSDLTWLTVSPSATSHTLNLPGTAEEYLFGISADAPTFSSGLLWSTCTYYHNKIPEKAPKNFQFTGVTVHWQRHTCEESSPDLTYTLRFCDVETVKEKTGEPNCMGPIEERNITVGHFFYTLEVLEGGRVYAASLETSTNGVLGPSTGWIYSSIFNPPMCNNLTG